MTCVFWWGILQKIDCTIFYELQLPLCFFNLFEIWWSQGWILCLQKSVLLSLVLRLLPFYEPFSFPVKNKKWTFAPLSNIFLKFLWEAGACESKNVHPKLTVFCGQFYQEALTLFWWNLLIRQWSKFISKQKLSYVERMTLLTFLGGSK